MITRRFILKIEFVKSSLEILFCVFTSINFIHMVALQYFASCRYYWFSFALFTLQMHFEIRFRFSKKQKKRRKKNDDTKTKFMKKLSWIICKHILNFKSCPFILVSTKLVFAIWFFPEEKNYCFRKLLFKMSM